MASLRIPAAAIAAIALFNAHYVAGLSGSAPENYTGIPDGDYSTEWQSYFQVSNNALGLDFDPGTNYAGNIYVDRPNHPNDSLFFWAFEKKNGSLTADANGSSTDPWAIWLQGG
ncbi:hypothetical protein EIP86_010964 [Pleurotus ostreatoroseus]|nr:hypothetical protein EIP86_010964 [Pleurotus ostreatoroseus]